MTLKIIISAGGTGGHLFPAIALADYLKSKGHLVELITDLRCQKYLTMNELQYSHFIDARPISLLNPLSVINLLKSVFSSWRIIRKLKTDFVISFGGYPTIPAQIAALAFGYKIIIHEQNSVAGRVNKLFSFVSALVFTSYKETRGFREGSKFIYSGLPIRRNILAKNKKNKNNNLFTILIIGGSQGASIFSRIIPDAIAKLDKKYHKKLRVIQQVRQKDEIAKLEQFYNKLGVESQISDFFIDMDQLYNLSDCIIARSGASSVAEIAYNKIPAILIPYKLAKDNHQYFNAKYLFDSEAAMLINEEDLTIDNLSDKLELLLEDGKMRQKIQNNLQKIDNIDAAQIIESKLIKLQLKH
jgi:UDP-N-acetylglucosamine--N-acetylmuramyl-(pentapeptide) pyrophosphoryl-undecaprenol N-acetylglucosamine transferase